MSSRSSNTSAAKSQPDASAPPSTPDPASLVMRPTPTPDPRVLLLEAEVGELRRRVKDLEDAHTVNTELFTNAIARLEMREHVLYRIAQDVSDRRHYTLRDGVTLDIAAYEGEYIAVSGLADALAALRERRERQVESASGSEFGDAVVFGG